MHSFTLPISTPPTITELYQKVSCQKEEKRKSHLSPLNYHEENVEQAPASLHLNLFAFGPEIPSC